MYSKGGYECEDGLIWSLASPRTPHRSALLVIQGVKENNEDAASCKKLPTTLVQTMHFWSHGVLRQYAFTGIVDDFCSLLIHER